jgi:protease II
VDPIYRYKYLEETAFEYAFLLDVLGLLAEEGA